MRKMKTNINRAAYKDFSHLTFDYVKNKGFTEQPFLGLDGSYIFEKGVMKITKDWYGWDFYYRDKEVCGEVSTEREFDELLRTYERLHRKEKLKKIWKI